MERFIGRSRELQALEEIYGKDGFQMTVIYGRRRVGKSTLIREFAKNKRTVYYTAAKTNIRQNLAQLGRTAVESLAPGFTGVSFESAGDLFHFLGEQSKNERLLLVIDELPYLAEADAGFLSLLKNSIDSEWEFGRMHLILCGSSVSFMEDKILSEKSPLFGRRTSQIRLQPFDYRESALFVPDYSAEEKAVIYGITGGIAKYLSLVDGNLSLDENIVRLYFRKDAYLYEEPDNLLTQEFRNVSLYGDVIRAVASGAVRVNEIADLAHADSSAIVHVLAALTGIGIVRRETAITDEHNRRKTQYRLSDGMFRFWYYFLPAAISLIEMGKGTAYYERAVKPRLSEYMGEIFEEMCRHYTLEKGSEGEFGLFVTKTGKWWGTDPAAKEQTDIDVVGIDPISHNAVIGECKYKNEVLDKSVYDALRRRSRLIDHKYVVTSYLLFSKSGFSDWIMNETDEKQVRKITLEDLYE